jgi:hypothetical protein
VVLNGNYVAAGHSTAGAAIPGFALGDEAGLPSRGFSLGESEITLTSNIDPFFYGALTASISGDDDISVEEAYIQTTALPGGITLKGGRFFSAIGYLNERHAHNWSFIDMPLPYRALLGVQYGDDGLQARWLVPAPIFLEVGGELFRGDHFPAGRRRPQPAGNHDGVCAPGLRHQRQLQLAGGLSYLHADARGRETGSDLFNGRENLGIASLTYKWAPAGNLGGQEPGSQRRVLPGQAERGLQRRAGEPRPERLVRAGRLPVRQALERRPALRPLDADGVPLPLIGSTLDPRGRNPSAVSGPGRVRHQRIWAVPRPVHARRRRSAVQRRTAAAVHDRYGPHGAHPTEESRQDAQNHPGGGRRRAAGARADRPGGGRTAAGVRLRAGVAALAREIGGDKVVVYAATTGVQDPAPHPGAAQLDLQGARRRPDGLHRRRTGNRLAADDRPAVGQQEDRRRRARSLQPSDYVRLLEAPASLDRSQGDLHAGGNPHIQADPRQHAAGRQGHGRPLRRTRPRQRRRLPHWLRELRANWNAALARWQAKAAPLRGHPHRRPAPQLALSRAMAGPAPRGGPGAQALACRPPAATWPRCWRC